MGRCVIRKTPNLASISHVGAEDSMVNIDKRFKRDIVTNFGQRPIGSLQFVGNLRYVRFPREMFIKENTKILDALARVNALTTEF